MRMNRAKKTGAVPKRLVELECGLVILPLSEYMRLLENTVPAVYLKGRSARSLDRLVTEGLRDHVEGRTRRITSLADLDQ